MFGWVLTSSDILFHRAIQLPQQPLPIIHTLQSASQFKPVTTISSNGQIPVMAANISSIMPKFAATAVAAHQKVAIQQQQQQQQCNEMYFSPGNISVGGTTFSASVVTSSYLPTTSTTTTTSNRIENELTCPPGKSLARQKNQNSKLRRFGLPN